MIFLTVPCPRKPFFLCHISFSLHLKTMAPRKTFLRTGGAHWKDWILLKTECLGCTLGISWVENLERGCNVTQAGLQARVNTTRSNTIYRLSWNKIWRIKQMIGDDITLLEYKTYWVGTLYFVMLKHTKYLNVDSRCPFLEL